MVTTNELLAKTGITYPVLNKYKELNLIPKPNLKGLGRGNGVIGEFNDDVIDIINWVKLHQQRGLSLSEIAEIRRKELAEIEVIKPIEEYLIPLKADPVKSYLDAYGDLYNWIQEEIEQQRPGFELYGVDTEKVIRNGEDFLKPKIIKIRPKTGEKRG